MSNINDFEITNGWLTKYKGNDSDVVIPDTVTTIDSYAFADCETLISVVIPESVKTISWRAFENCTNLKKVVMPEDKIDIACSCFKGCTNFIIDDDFLVVNNTLYEYSGNDKTVLVPDEVSRIAESVFSSNLSIEKIILPNHTVKIGGNAFYGCSNLKYLMLTPSSLIPPVKWSLMFGSSGKTVELELLLDRKTSRRVIGAFRKEYWSRDWKIEEDFLIPLTTDDLPHYDNLVATGDYDGFRMNEQGRIKAMILRLLEKERPIAPEYKKMFLEFLSGKFGKVVKIAEEDGCVPYVLSVIEAGIVNDSNKKKIKNALNKSVLSEINELADKLDSFEVTVENDSNAVTIADNVDKKYIDRLKKINAEAVLLKSGVSDLPKVLMADKERAAPDEYVKLVIAEYISQLRKTTYALSPIAEEVVEKLDRKSLSSALIELYEKSSSASDRLSRLTVVFRFVEGALINRLYKSFQNDKKEARIADKSLILSDTREAILLADKKGLIDTYAEARGVKSSELLDSVLYDFGFDDNGKKIYDIGNKKIEISLNTDLSLAIFDSVANKSVKSIPKKGADIELYEKAYADFSDIKKNIKKAVKNKTNSLFSEFLNADKHTTEAWKNSYLYNPMLRTVANLIVWDQNGTTFILKNSLPITSDGNSYTINDKEIKVAHPMEMKKEEIEAWQNYFVNNGLKQPFEQIWEPAYSGDSIKSDRYKGCMIPYYRFVKQEKRGISVQDYDFHNDITINFQDCSASVVRIDWQRHHIDMNDCFEIESFEFRKHTRRVNHLVSYFDRITVYDKIKRDDVSIESVLSSFTLAQISNFIKVASENNAVNVTALLLEYKNKHFAVFDVMDEFVLE